MAMNGPFKYKSQHVRAKSENMEQPLRTVRADKQVMDTVQPRKMTGRNLKVSENRIRVAPGTRGISASMGNI
jgi:hypothetical protein